MAAVYTPSVNKLSKNSILVQISNISDPHGDGCFVPLVGIDDAGVKYDLKKGGRPTYAFGAYVLKNVVPTVIGWELSYDYQSVQQWQVIAMTLQTAPVADPMALTYFLGVFAKAQVDTVNTDIKNISFIVTRVHSVQGI